LKPTCASGWAEFPQSALVLYPELHLCPPATVELMHRRAEPLTGPRMAFLCGLAAELRVWLVPGSFYEHDEAGRVFNTAVAISPQGEVAAWYRKCFPWRPWERVTPGREFVVFDIPGLTRIGLSICYDTWFPETARQLAWMGAEVILQPTLTPTADRAQELVLSQAAAISNQLFVVSLNAAAPQATGQSVVVDPEGHVLLQAGDGPAALTHVLVLDQVDATRRYGTAGLNRPWAQFIDSDAPIDLPVYGGQIDPRRWPPASRS
jgi:predicted amidohydrolase